MCTTTHNGYCGLGHLQINVKSKCCDYHLTCVLAAKDSAYIDESISPAFV